MAFIQTEFPFNSGADSTFSVCHQLDSSKASEVVPIVFIVGGNKVACELLAALIMREGWRLERFASGKEFLAHPVELEPGCLILDASLPGLSGLDLQKRSVAKYPHIPTIFLSAKDDTRTTVAAMKFGAVEFFTRPFRDNEILSAVREALERSRQIVARKAEKQALQRCYASLTLRQRQVMAWVSSGLINKQVGEELGISEITVKAHRMQVMRKMQAASLADLVRMAGKLGLAKRREAMTLRDDLDRAGNRVGQLKVRPCTWT